jgi:hypothetical protein
MSSVYKYLEENGQTHHAYKDGGRFYRGGNLDVRYMADTTASLEPNDKVQSSFLPSFSLNPRDYLAK